MSIDLAKLGKKFLEVLAHVFLAVNVHGSLFLIQFPKSSFDWFISFVLWTDETLKKIVTL